MHMIHEMRGFVRGSSVLASRAVVVSLDPCSRRALVCSVVRP